MHLGHGPGRVLETLPHRLLGVLHERHPVLEAPVHLGRHLLKLHRDRALELAELLRHLPAEGGHVCADRGQRGVLATLAFVADTRDLALKDLEPGVQAIVRRLARATGQDHHAPDHRGQHDQRGQYDEEDERRVGHWPLQ